MNVSFLLLLISAVFLIGCTAQEEETQDQILVVDTTKMRNEVLEDPMVWLKESPFAILYERKVAQIKNDSLYGTITFDLHDGSRVPDTYGVHLSFSFPLVAPFEFPQKMIIKESEFSPEGENDFVGNFGLKALNKELLIYTEEGNSRCLVVFKNRGKTNDCAYYFDGEEAASIDGENVYSMIENAYEEGEQVIMYARSFALLNNE